MKSLLLSAALAVGLIGSAFLAQPAMATATPTVVKIQDFAYTPASVTIEVGQTVEWIRRSATHTATAIDGTFKSPNLEKAASRTPSRRPGRTYYCAFHRGMKGTVVVK